MSSFQKHGSSPHVPTNATPGLHPNVVQDIAPSADLLALYITSGVCHQIIFQRNRRCGHKFLMSWAMFGFAMARKGTLVLRIAWATRLNNGSVALTANVFAFLGVVVIYVVVLFLSLRVLRAWQPRLGWNFWLDKGIKFTYAVLLVVILLVLPSSILNGFTTDPQLLRACAWIIKSGVFYFFLFNLIAPVLFLLALFLPRPKDVELENFSTGSSQAKLVILAVFSSSPFSFRHFVLESPGRPIDHFQSLLGFELIITSILISVRFDRRFWIPDGSKRPGDYSSIDLDGSENTPFQLDQVQERKGSAAKSS
ncbi:hypothetical protein SVAN01_11448 [Stagonosporopsis vannaccii]|nr:hypothetical protein SVAN01_11448 [Stagonosporopsis vannaccii]